MNREIKWSLGNIVATIAILTSLYGFGVWSGIMWVTLDQFNAAVAQIDDRLGKVERMQYIDRVLELLEKRDVQQGVLTGQEQDELCTKAEILGWEVERCRG